MRTPKSPDELWRDACERAIAYRSHIDARPAFPAAEAIERLRELDTALPEEGAPAEQVLALLDERASQATVASTGGRCFGYVIGGADPSAVAAEWLATAWDQNAIFHSTSPAATALERIALRWIVDLLRLPADTHAALVTGTTMANVSALATARHALLAERGHDVEAEGLYGAPRITVLAGRGAHGTLDKALRLLGLGAGNVVRVPVDEQGRMVPAKIPDTNGPTILCAQLGNVDGGACDPLAEIAAVAKRRGAWLHVDGAYGAWARAAPSRARYAAGLELADSCATDLHKWLNVPYDSGVVLVQGRARDAMRAAHAMSGAYFPPEADFDPGRWTPDSSRRARGVAAWAVIKTLGRAGVAERIERTCEHARAFADGLARAGHAILTEVVLNQVLVSFGDDARTRAVIDALAREGTCWCTGTTWRGRAAMRISVSSWATTSKDVERSLAAMLSIARES